ncbi:MAG TPA: ABC transporter substrate-binding protein [Mariprofundaceae bacterium]|nr:ABC transporter substrate-binding protein [Mariprofundaceae bacterium]
MSRILNPVRTALAAVALLGAMALPAQAAQANTPDTVIRETVEGIIHVLDHRADKSRISEIDRAAIRKIISDHFDFDAMSRLSVGAPWNDATPEQQARFTTLFRDLLEYSYGNRLNGYHGQTIRYDDAEYKGDKARIKSMIIDTDKQTPVEYRLLKDGDNWRVYDIRIEGVSLISTFRTDFQNEIDSAGFDGLLKSLAKKVEDLKAKDKKQRQG